MTICADLCPQFSVGLQILRAFAIGFAISYGWTDHCANEQPDYETWHLVGEYNHLVIHPH